VSAVAEAPFGTAALEARCIAALDRE